MAVGQIESDTVESGHVAEVVQKGYSLNGVLIRPARVIVAK
jgi:molecular chaperone GrpE (heat shock protein)